MECFVVDAFASQAFRGNPAGVCFLEEDVDDEWMHSVAAELKHSETAFVRPRADGSFGLRWWTPEVEVPLCGHATLASAHALFETGRLARDATAVFHTASGELRATRADDGRIAMDLPVAPIAISGDRPDLVAAVGTEPVSTAQMPFFAVVEYGDASTVRALAPDFEALRAVDTDAVIATAPADEGDFDVVVRVFAPRIGILEDPATGSALCALVPYWEARLGPELRVAQLSPRGAELHGRRCNDDRVEVSGTAVTVLAGLLVARGTSS